jgi:hypothetical protein
MNLLQSITESLAKIEARENAAKAGPWHVGSRKGFNASNIYAFDGKDEYHDTNIASIPNISLHRTLNEVEGDKRNRGGLGIATFIAHSRSDVPRLRKALEMAVKALKFYSPKVPIGRTAAVALEEIAGELKS